MKITGENGKIIVAMEGAYVPFSYINGQLSEGYDVDFIYRFCREYGYDLLVNDYSFDGLTTALSTGKCDIGAAGICITDERKESINFTDPYYESDCVIIVKEIFK